MRNREFYEEELRSLDSIDTSSEAIRRVAKEIQQIEDRERQGKVDREQGIKGTGLNNEARRRLKELRILQGRMERKEELEVLLNMNGIEEFTQEAELDSAQEEALEMVDTIIDSNAERAANEAKGKTTLEEGRTLTGKTGQRESVKGYYMTEVPVQLTTKKRDIQIRKDQMSKNSMLGASIQLVTLQKLATRTDISEAQIKMINRLITYFNRVLDMYAQQDKEFAENVRQAEEVEQDVGVEQEEVSEQEGERNSNPSDKKEEKQPEKIEDEEEIDYDNLTEEQKRNFQIKGLQANLDKIIEQLKALAEQRDAYDKIVNESQNPQEKNQAQLMASKMRMQMTPLQNQAQELVQQINNLQGRVEQTKQDQPQEQAEQSKEEQQVEQSGAEQQVEQAGEEQQVGQAKEEQQKGQAEKQEQEDEREAQVQAETGEKQDDGKAKEKEVEEPEEKKEKQGNQQKQTIENVSGIKAILETLIRVLQAITRNPKLLEGTRQKLVNIQQLPSGIDPKLASTQENSATRENAEEIAERLGANEEEKQEVQHETEKAEEEQGTIVTKDFSKVEAILQEGWKSIYNNLEPEYRRAFWRSFIKSIEINWTTNKKEVTKVTFF